VRIGRHRALVIVRVSFQIVGVGHASSGSTSASLCSASAEAFDGDLGGRARSPERLAALGCEAASLDRLRRRSSGSSPFRRKRALEADRHDRSRSRRR